MSRTLIWLSRLFGLFIVAYAGFGLQQTWYLNNVDPVRRHIFESEFDWKVDQPDAVLLIFSGVIILTVSFLPTRISK